MNVFIKLYKNVCVRERYIERMIADQHRINIESKLMHQPNYH